MSGSDELGIARRHAAVAFADIVGYTTLMALDDRSAHDRWMSLLNNVFEPLAEQYGGRIVKLTGDGVAAEFLANESAFAWAAAVQRSVAASDEPGLPPVSFRIGIACGEVTVTGRDLYGGCVNIAARLQEHCPVGGVLLSTNVQHDLEGVSQLVDVGMIHLRNIPDPVRAWALYPSTVPRTPARPAQHELPRVAVMPFDIDRTNQEDRFLANGLIEDIVVSLGSLRDLSVIARGATLAWSGAAKDPREIARILGVRYLFLGTLRRLPGKLRLLVELREANEGDSLWSDRIDFDLSDLFCVQDEVVERIALGVAPSIRAAELRRALRQRPGSLSAYELTLRGLFALDGLTRVNFHNAGTMLHRAIAEDPTFAMPVAWAAQWHSLAVGQGWTNSPQIDAVRSGELAQRAVQLDPRNALGFAMCGHHRAYHQRDPESALPFFDRALGACPSHAMSWTLKSASLSYLGRGADAVDAARRGHSLWPHGPERYYFEFFVGLAEYAAGNYREAVRWSRLSLRDNPAFTSAHKALMAALVAQGENEEARGVGSDMMLLDPTFRLSTYERDKMPIVDTKLRRQLIDHMRSAGVPE